MIRSLSTSLLAVGLLLCLLVGTVTPAYAADSDLVSDYLATVLGVKGQIGSYATDYKNSLPIDYVKSSDSYYVALGGGTAYGHGSDRYETCYADLIAGKYGFGDNYDLMAEMNGLAASDAVSYIKGRNVSKAIKQADLITFQIDGVALMSASKETMLDVAANNASLNWGAYITDAAALAEIKNFRADLTAEYEADFGKNAGSIAMALECMLYECVVYSVETMNAVSTIRGYNSDAVILVLGLYNPLRNLSITANGTTIQIGSMVDSMIKVCNTYLLKQTKNLTNTAFIDVSATNTTGFGNIALDLSNPDALTSKLYSILGEEDKQYANQKGHDYIANQVYGNAKAPCKHSTTTVSGKKDATCQEKGYTGDTICKDCGKVIKKGSETAKASHDYSAWTQIKAPTCTEKGEESRSCKVCSTPEIRQVAAAGHAWDKGTVTTQPTCTKKGVKTFNCTVCQNTKTESVNMIDHKWDDGVVNTEPTCETKGKKTLTCTECKQTSTKTINATGHAWDKGVVTTEPTCVTEGVKTTTCTTCNKATTEAIPTVDHTFDEGVITTAPTCDTEGVKTITCTGCGLTNTETVPTTEHAFDEGSVTTAPTCEAAGEKTTTCTICGKTTTESIAATGHSYGEYTSNGDATCKQDGTKSATCANCDAKDTVADIGSKTEHAYKDGVCTYCNEAEPSTEKTPEEEPKNNTVVWVIVGASAAVVLAGGAAGFVFIKRKRIV